MHNPTIGIVIIINTAQSSCYNIPIFVDTFVTVEKKLLCVRKITALFAVSCEVSEGLHPSVNTCNKALFFPSLYYLGTIANYLSLFWLKPGCHIPFKQCNTECRLNMFKCKVHVLHICPS